MRGLYLDSAFILRIRVLIRDSDKKRPLADIYEEAHTRVIRIPLGSKLMVICPVADKAVVEGR